MADPERDPKDELIQTLQQRNDLLVSENQRLFAEVQRVQEECNQLREFCRMNPVAITAQGIYDAFARWF